MKAIEQRDKIYRYKMGFEPGPSNLDWALFIVFFVCFEHIKH